MDVGCYGIDLVRFLVEEEPEEVTARGVSFSNSGVDELTTVILRFPRGVMGVLTASTHLARHHAYCVRGTLGTVSVPKAFVPRETETTQLVVELATGQRRIEDFPACNPFAAEIARFAKAAQANTSVDLTPFEDGVANANVLEAAVRSLQEGIIVPL